MQDAKHDVKRRRIAKRRSERNDGGAEGDDEERNGRGKCPFPLLDVALTLFGFCYDVFSVSLAVACMVVDVVVGVQLYQGGHTVWAWCVLGVFFDACAINAFLFATILQDSMWDSWATRSLRNMSRPLVFILLLQVSPFLVPIHWFAATYLLEHNRKAPPVVNLSSAATTRVAREEAAAVERSAFVIGRLGAALTKQESNYILLNAHALAEALPQFVVQLLAVSILGSPSSLQVASIVMSLVAVLSKVSFFCFSCSVEVFAVKLLFLCHDAFSLAYVVTTLLSRDDPTRTSELPFLHVMVSVLGYMWFVKEFLFVCTILLFSVGFLVGLVAAHFLRIRGWEISWQNLKEGFFIACFFVIAFVPGLLVLEGFKLSYLIFLLLNIEPAQRGQTHLVTLFSFLRHGNSTCRASLSMSPDWRGKIEHLYSEAADVATSKSDKYRRLRWGFRS